MSASAEELTKVVFELDESAPTHTETLWAQPLGSMRYRLDNMPWFARGCALGDIVRCEETEGELPRFVEVMEPSGNLAVRVFVPKGPRRAATILALREDLERFGCVYEGMGEDKGLIAVTIPAGVPSASVIDMLNGLEAREVAFWEAGNF